MTDSLSSSTNPAFADSPDAGSAADALRAAAEGQAIEREPSATEVKALALKEKAAEKAAQLREFAGEKASDLKAVAASKFETLKDNAEETAGSLRGVASEQWQDTRVKARELHVSMEDYVRQNPTKSILTAVGVGFLAGLLIRR